MPKIDCPICDLKNCFHKPSQKNNYLDIFFTYSRNKQTNLYTLEFYSDRIKIYLLNGQDFKPILEVEFTLLNDKNINTKNINKIMDNLIFS